MLYHYPSWICASHMCTVLPRRGTCWWYYFACRNNLISWELYAYNDNKSYGILFIPIVIFHLANLYFKTFPRKILDFFYGILTFRTNDIITIKYLHGLIYQIHACTKLAVQQADKYILAHGNIRGLPIPSSLNIFECVLFVNIQK